MNAAVIERYVDEAIRFRPRSSGRLRVARTLVTCSATAAALNARQVPEESETTYRYVNVHNPRCPLGYNRAEGRWVCAPAFEEHPVWGLNWAGAALVCEHLGGRLPTVPEWESFASNNDPERTYPWGNAEPTHLMANYDEHYGGTSRVGEFPPSDIGLYDLAGNLSEWCLDHHASGGGGNATSFERVAKGGAWSKDARYLQIAVSRGKWARLGTTTIGFRPVWDD